MKILKLKFKNLNSLYGAWEIDFTDRRYDRYGIFSIIGPTGSGKTTILDAICLALYGRTPRLKSVGKASNEIMSKQKGECSAELLFSVEGKRYRCFWEQRRAYNKFNSNLQTQTHIIYDDDGNELCRKDIGKEGGFVSKLINMSFDQFTQCILLAQGSFAKFLNAGKDEKAAIFEKITGTSIYRSISVKVFERYKDEKKKLEDIDKDKHGLTVFSPEEETEKKQEFAKLDEDIKKIRAEQKECEGKLGVLEDKNTAEDNYKRAVKAKEAAEKALNDFIPQAEALEKAERAAGIADIYTRWQKCEGNVKECDSEFKKEQDSLPALLEKSNKINLQIKSYEDEIGLLEVEFEKLSSLLAKVEQFEAIRGEKEKYLDNAIKAINKKKQELSDCEKSLDDVIGELAEFQEKLRKLNDERQELIKYEGVSERLSGWKELLNQLQRDISALDNLKKGDAETSLQNLEDERQSLINAKANQKQNVDTKQADIDEAEAELKQLLGGSDKEKLELKIEALKAEIENIKLRASLEEHRRRLQDGCPCPLCGSREHPYAQGQLPAFTDKEKLLSDLKKKLNDIKGIEERISLQKEELQNLNDIVKDSEHAIELKAAEIENKKAALVALSEMINNNSGEIADKLSSLKAELESLIQIGSDFDANNIEGAYKELKTAYETLEKKSEAFNGNTLSMNNLNAQIFDINKNVEMLQKDKKNHSDRVDELDKNILSYKKDIEELSQRILTETDGVEVEVVRGNRDRNINIRKDIKLRLDGDDGLRKELEKAKDAVTSCKTRIKTLTESKRQLESELSEVAADWMDKLAKSGFADENAFAAAKKNDNEIEGLKIMQADLRDKVNQAEGAQAESKRIFEAAAKAAEGLQADEIKKELKDIIAGIDDLDGKRIGLKSALDRNEENKKRVGSLEEEYKAQKAVFEIWNTLNDLIGSTGDKYPKFVQNLTLKVLLEQANEALKKMNDRFIMLPGSGEDLEFKVKDLYQGSFERSVKNLSGGESFIVSLALALGLSRMAGRSARIDSFFLDEGFGTLDEDTLGTVMEALKQLRDEGKTIGIISHVDALKELPVRIEVKPEGATGRSIIDGPGCRRLPNDAANETSAGKKSGRRSKKG